MRASDGKRFGFLTHKQSSTSHSWRRGTDVESGTLVPPAATHSAFAPERRIGRLQCRRCARPGRSVADDSLRGEAIAALAGARRAEAIVPAIEPDDRYSGIAHRGATDVAASRCRQSASRLETVIAIEAIVRQHDRRPSNGATGAGRPSLLPEIG